MGGMTFPISFGCPIVTAAVAADRTYAVASRWNSGNQLLHVTPVARARADQRRAGEQIIVPVAPCPTRPAAFCASR